MSEQVYAVYAKHVDRNILLGFCISDTYDDIEAYYEEKKAYGLEIEPVHPVRIPAKFAIRKKELVKRRLELEKQLKELERNP